MRTEIKLIFVKMGFLYWMLIGAFVGLVSFEPTIPIESIKASEKINSAYSEAWFKIIFSTTLYWGLAGAFLGVCVFLFFTSRPSYLHNTPVPISHLSTPPGYRGPKSMAEIVTMPFVMISGVIINLLMFYFILPICAFDMIAVRTDYAPLILSSIQAMLFSIMILSSSLKRIEKKFG